VNGTVPLLGVETTEVVGEVGEETPRVWVEVIWAGTLAVELWKDGMMLAVELEAALLVGIAQVAQATLAETVTGITAVHGQSVIVTVVASVMVEVSEPWTRTVGLGQYVVRAVTVVVK